MELDLPVAVDWIRKLNPCVVWIGYDTKACGLPQPTAEAFRELQWQIARLGVPVRIKRADPMPSSGTPAWMRDGFEME